MLSKRQQIALTVFAICLIISLVAGISGWCDWQLITRGKAAPQDIRVGDLAANGPGDNVHVHLLDFEFGKDYVVEKLNGQWSYVYVPVYPRGTVVDSKRAPTPQVVVKASGLHGPKDVESFCQRGAVTGVITNSIDQANFNLSELKKKYPDLKPSSVWLVEQGLAFPKETGVYLRAGAAGVLGVIAVVSMVLCFMWQAPYGAVVNGADRAQEQVIARRT